MTGLIKSEGTTTRELRPYQVRAINSVFAKIREGSKRPMLQIATGGGKTALSAAIIRMGLKAGRRMIFTVPRVDLIDQTVESFYMDGIREVGVIQADHPMTDYSKPVQVASLQSLERREIPKADLVIIDEAHEMRKLVIQWMASPSWANIPFIGLSATPWAKGLGKIYTDLIVAATTDQLIADGYLSPFKVWAPSKPDLTSVKTIAGDHQIDQLSEAMQEGGLVADIVSTWLEKGGGEPTIAFCVDRAHAKVLQSEFEAVGVPCGYVDYLSSREAVREVGRKLRAGEIKIVCNVDKLTTGVDWDVRCIINARPTKSEMRYVQAIGRGLRTAPGKEFLRILDHADATETLGFVTDIHHDRLSMGKKPENKSSSEKAKPKPKTCPECSYVRESGPTCPSCGHTVVIKSEIVSAPGELVEIDGARKRGKAREMTMAEKAAFFGELRGYAAARGYSEGWAANQYKSKLKVWPNHPSIRGAAMREPSAATMAWIRHQQIAYAKRKERAA